MCALKWHGVTDYILHLWYVWHMIPVEANYSVQNFNHGNCIYSSCPNPFHLHSNINEFKVYCLLKVYWIIQSMHGMYLQPVCQVLHTKPGRQSLAYWYWNWYVYCKSIWWICMHENPLAASANTNGIHCLCINNWFKGHCVYQCSLKLLYVAVPSTTYINRISHMHKAMC